MPRRRLASSASTAPVSLTSVATRVEKRIDTLFEAELARWSALDTNMAEPLRSLRKLIDAGGKRLRPAFCHWAFVGAGGDPEDPCVVDAGAAFELLHAFALTHDDVMDGSDTRRGRPTAHIEHQGRHLREAWLGEPRRFGEGAAILIGDLAHVYADLLIHSASQDGGLLQVAPVWNELRLELNMGQYLDVLGTARGDRAPDIARRINRYKAGRYTIERPLHVGAALAWRLDNLGPALSAYGDPLGEAFQLRDDVLGTFGDPALTGKPVGQDLREGKPTPLLATACQRADGSQSEVLDQVGRGDLEDEVVASVQEVLVSTGALADVERRITELAEQAVEAMEDTPVAPDAREALVELAHFVATRTS